MPADHPPRDIAESIAQSIRELKQDDERGWRSAPNCHDCGGERIQFLIRATREWSAPHHRPGETCVILLRRRIEQLEAEKLADHPPAEGTVTADALADVKRLWHELTALPHDPGNVIVTAALYDSLDRLSEYGDANPDEGNDMTCTRCEKQIQKGESFHRTKKGPHHALCPDAVAALKKHPAAPAQGILSREEVAKQADRIAELEARENATIRWMTERGVRVEYPGELLDVLKQEREIALESFAVLTKERDAYKASAGDRLRRIQSLLKEVNEARAELAALQAAKALRRKWETEGPDNRLFEACFRIQREAIEATGITCEPCCGFGKLNAKIWLNPPTCPHCAGKGFHYRHIPLIVENVRGAQEWVGAVFYGLDRWMAASREERWRMGRSAWNFGSFHLWGDVPALMPISIGGRKGTKPVPNRGWTAGTAITLGLENYNGIKGTIPHGNGSTIGAADPSRVGATSWFHGKRADPRDGARFGSKSNARRMASALIAKIPADLSGHIARVYRPQERATA